MRLTMGLPSARWHDGAIRDAIALYAHDIKVRQRTLIARVDSSHDFCMLVDALESERLLGLMRWININRSEDQT